MPEYRPRSGPISFVALARWCTFVIGALVCAVALGAVALAQQQPRSEEDIVWSTFVGGPGRSPSRGDIGGDPGELSLGGSPWRCGYGRIRHAAVAADDWSVQRVLACQRGEATVSSTASCRVHDRRVDEHAATLSLGSTGDSAHVTVTLSCRPR